MFLNYKEKAKNNREKIIKNDVKKMKDKCIKEFHINIKNGLDITNVDFFNVVNSNFLDETSEITLTELKKENKGIEFSFCWRHCQNSYKGIKMVAL